MKKLFAFSIIAASMSGAFIGAQEINLGILGGQNSKDQIGNNQCAKAFIEKETGVTVNIRNASDYNAVIQGLLGNQVDLVLNMSPKAFATVYLQDKNKVELIGIATDDGDQSKGYRSIIIVKTDSPYQRLDDLKGTRFAFADVDSTSGFLIPNNQFSQQLGGDIEDRFNGFFTETSYSGGHEQSIVGVLNGQYDAAVTWASMVGNKAEGYSAGALRKLKDSGFDTLMDDVRIIWQSPLIPNSPTVIRSDLDPKLKEKLIQTVKKLDKENHDCFIKATGGERHLSEVTISDYQTVIDLVEAQNAKAR